MSFILAGIGTATPGHVIEQADSANLAENFGCHSAKQQQLLQTLYRRTGVKTRRSVVLESSTNCAPARQTFYETARSEQDHGPSTAKRMEVYESTAAPLGLAAASAALTNAGIAPDEITHLITISCSGFSAPGFDVALLRDLNLPSTCSRTHVGFMGCHGAMNGLRVAKAFTDADPNACVLLCAVELCSLHQQYGWSPQKIVANALFADGAAAVVGWGSRAARRRDEADWRLTHSWSALVANSEDCMSWRIRDHGFEMKLSSCVPDLIRRKLRPPLEHWLDELKLSLGQVGSWAIHPGGPRVLRACAESLDLDPADLSCSTQILAEFGNMSSPTVLFVLERLRACAAARPCVMLGFGPGLAIEAALIS